MIYPQTASLLRALAHAEARIARLVGVLESTQTALELSMRLGMDGIVAESEMEVFIENHPVIRRIREALAQNPHNGGGKASP